MPRILIKLAPYSRQEDLPGRRVPEPGWPRRREISGGWNREYPLHSLPDGCGQTERKEPFSHNPFWAPPPLQRKSFRWKAAAAQSLMGNVVPAESQVGGVPPGLGTTFPIVPPPDPVRSPWRDLRRRECRTVPTSGEGKLGAGLQWLNPAVEPRSQRAAVFPVCSVYRSVS